MTYPFPTITLPDGTQAAEGNDVSRWQGPIGHGAYPYPVAAGKATGGDAGLYTDGRYVENARGFTARGTIFGTYHFCSRAQFDPIVEADHYTNTILNSPWVDQPAGKRLGPAADWEPTGGLVPGGAGWLRRFIERCEDRTQEPGVIYTAQWCRPIGAADDLAALATRPLWLASYVDWFTALRLIPAPWARFAFWQYSSTSRTPGIAGNVDANYFRADDLLAVLGSNPTPSAPDQPQEHDMAQPIYRMPEGDEYLLAVSELSPTGLGWVHIASQAAVDDATRNRLALPTETVNLAAGNDAEDQRWERHPVLSGPQKRDTYTAA